MIEYALCRDGSIEEGREKIALYAKEVKGARETTHAARQLPSGDWTSKLGDLEDITHSRPEDLEGPIYGSVCCYLSRATGL